MDVDAAAIGTALTAIREQLEVVRQLKSQLTSISNATKAVWAGLDTMRSNILARVTKPSRRSAPPPTEPAPPGRLRSMVHSGLVWLGPVAYARP